MEKQEKLIKVNLDRFNPNAVEVDVFGQLQFSVSFKDAKQLAKDLNDTVTSIVAARRLQNWIDGKELRDGTV